MQSCSVNKHESFSKICPYACCSPEKLAARIGASTPQNISGIEFQGSSSPVQRNTWTRSEREAHSKIQTCALVYIIYRSSLNHNMADSSQQGTKTWGHALRTKNEMHHKGGNHSRVWRFRDFCITSLSRLSCCNARLVLCRSLCSVSRSSCMQESHDMPKPKRKYARPELSKQRPQGEQICILLHVLLTADSVNLAKRAIHFCCNCLY